MNVHKSSRIHLQNPPAESSGIQVPHADYMAGPRNFYTGNCEGMVLSQERLSLGEARFGMIPLKRGKPTYPLANVNKKLWIITMLLMGKLTISMAIFNSYVRLPEGRCGKKHHVQIMIILRPRHKK